MNIRVLGCSGAIAAGYKTTAFLLDDDVLIDAGTGVGDLPLQALAAVDHILLSHSHLDHVLGIPLLADAVLRLRAAAGRPPVQVHALPETLAALRQHIFNGVIWPDFTTLPSRDAPVLSLHPFQIGERLDLGGRIVEILPAAHTVPAVGFAVDGGAAAGHAHWVFTGDTGPNPALWRRLAGLKLSHLVIETAFSDDEAEVAHVSQHLCPTDLGRELAQLAGSVDVRITHIKPGEVSAVMQGIGLLNSPHRISALAAGQTMSL
ncbi:3',5'-cyclic-nucleotide phosphodiesterase [Pelomonas aquatica]|jgi:ribonuclease BN (tRNA processing enzyme)|uniref:3',5'-cyclic-nucleotide phosphodiesterase n=1 Tax=Pelomonas aquatica TaxID=431058 RepID=A0A9X4LEN3_9BURK|nr:3',5'-cyclic-nucleotide phosphodiesterase [Pelomonas aquatica]MCY4752991.1 3',5'-cyclic-nucleotide phosphodiesterase [Pelomonas aquatica]MDG0862070.1 3',5'-cyclic-nucleotide phosphodiesterase [Pelomonas aquatica]